MHYSFKLIAIFFVTSMNQSFANNLIELQFLPEKNSIITSLSYKLTSSEDKVSVSSNERINPFYKVDQDRERIQLSTGYSLSDKLYLQASMPFSVKNKSKTTYQEGSTIDGQSFTRKNKGGGDPNLSAKYRIITEFLAKELWLDLTLAITPKTGKRKYPSTEKSGNIKRGGSSYSLITEAGFPKIKDISILLFIKHKLFSSAEGIDLFDQSEVKIKSFHWTSAGLRAQLKAFSDRFRFEGSIESGIISTQKIINLGLTSKIDETNFSAMAISFKYLIRPNILWSLSSLLEVTSYSLTSSSLDLTAERSATTYRTSITYAF